MTVTLQQAKDHLRVRHDDQDDLITDHMARALAAIVRLTGAGYEADEPDLDAAQLLIIEWLFRPEDEVRIDPIYGLPEAAVALAVPFRTPTLA